MELFLTTLQQVAVLLIFIFVGYFLRKKEIITEGAKTCFMSYILALGTMPIVFMLMEKLAAGF